MNETGAVLDSTAYGVLTRYNVDANTGMIAKVIDSHNHETSFTYDWGVLKDTVTPEYAPAAQIARTIKFDGTILSETRRSTTIKFEHDAVGRLEWVKPEAPHPGHWTRIEYDNVNGFCEHGPGAV